MVSLRQASFRHAAFYLRLLDSTRELYFQGGEATKRGLDLFDTEWLNIQAARSRLVSKVHEDELAAELYSAIIYTGLHLFDLRQHPHESIPWVGAALSAARRLGEREDEGLYLSVLANAYAEFGETQPAIDLYQQALKVQREISDRPSEGNTLGNQGNLYYLLDEFHTAIECHENHLSIARDVGDRRGQGEALGGLGLAYAALGQSQRAIDLYEQQLAVVGVIGDRRAEAHRY